MKVRARLEGIVRMASARPLVTLGVVLVLALAGAGLSLGLQPSAGPGTFVSSSSSSYEATADDEQHFGSDAVVILIRESLPNLVETKDLATVSQLEACVGAQTLVPDNQLGAFTPAAPGSQTPYGGWGSPCGKLMKAKPAQVVYGPGTFLNRAVAAVNTEVASMLSSAQQAIVAAGRGAYQLALGRGLSGQQAITAGRAAASLEQQQQENALAQTYLDSGITGTPRIDDPQFIPQIVFDQTRGVNQPKARLAYLFPTANSALIQVRLKSSLSAAQQGQAIRWIRQAVSMPMFRSAYGGTYLVTGEPVLTNDLASELTGSIGWLLLAALVVMAATLLIVFRSRLRLLPLVIALAAAGITFGVVALVGASLTVAAIAVLPILIGLSVDYAIQFQSRVHEAREGSDSAGDTRMGEHSEAVSAAQAVVCAARSGGPAIVTAAAATATGFLVLLLSPVPMVQGFGLLLVLGIAVALLCALTAGSAALVLSDRDGGIVGASVRGAGEILRAAGRGALWPVRRLGGVRRRLAGHTAKLPDGAGRLLATSLASPQRVIVVGIVLAALGWVADTRTSVQSDITKLVPSNLPALRNLKTLEAVTGVSGELDVTVRAANVATPTTIGWMTDYEQKLLRHYGFVEENGCARATLCPALSLPDLFSAGSGSGRSAAGSLTTASIQGLLHAVPNYFSQAVISPDHREAVLAFGIRLMPLSRQQGVVAYMRSQLHPPPGVYAQLAGLPVLAAQANSVLSSSARRLMTLLAGLLAVAVVLLAVYRRVNRAIVPLIPIALATGWSALLVFLIGIPLNPMSATLGTLVIAISTEFSVLLADRFRQERAGGYELAEALTRTYGRTAKAVVASGITAIAGFGVLLVSNITMLRDFGLVTLVDLSVSLAGVLVVLPSVLAMSERGDLVARSGERARRVGEALRLRRRRARIA